MLVGRLRAVTVGLLSNALHSEFVLSSERAPEPRFSVLHVVLSLDGGGLERVVIDLACEAATLQQRASILCVEKRGLLEPVARSTGLNIYCAQKGPGLRWIAVDAIRSILQTARPDVVHTHQMGALLYIARISRELMPVLVHTEHNNQLRRYRTLRDKLRYLSMLMIAGRRVDRMFGVSEDATQSIRQCHLIGPNKLSTVPNGIDLSRFRGGLGDDSLRRGIGIPAGSFVLGNVGRLDEMKRPNLLLSAFARINAEFPNTHLLLVGDGPLMPALRRQATALKISDRVHLVGFQSDPEPYLRLLDVFVSTSRMEGMPLAVLEAAAAGIPVIAPKVGGLEEMSNGGQAILIYDCGDMDDLHSGLQRLISNCSFRQKLAEAGRQHVLSTYSSKRMALDYSHHYAQLVATSRQRMLSSVARG